MRVYEGKNKKYKTFNQVFWSRRQLLKTGAGLLAGLSGLTSLKAFAAVPLIVVVGGGFGGSIYYFQLIWWSESND